MVWFYLFYRENKLFRPFNLILISEFLIIVTFGSEYVNLFLAWLSLLLSFIIFLTNKKSVSKAGDNGGIIQSFTNRYGLEGYLLYLGLALIFTIYFIDYYNRVLSDRGTIVIILALLLIIFDFLDSDFKTRHAFEIDFSIIFLFNLFLLLCFYSALSLQESYGDRFPFLKSDNQIEYLLSAPLSKTLNLIGIQSWYEGRLVFYPDLSLSLIVAVDITEGCSGLYSIFVFLSCFMSYLFSSTKEFNIQMLFSAMIAIMVSYVANIIRMVIIVIFGHYYGSDALIWTHKNVGWMIFTFWFMLFWYLFIKFEEGKSDSNLIS